MPESRISGPCGATTVVLVGVLISLVVSTPAQRAIVAKRQVLKHAINLQAEVVDAQGLIDRIAPYQKPAVKLTAPTNEIVISWPPECASLCMVSSPPVISLSTKALNSGNLPLTYTYSVEAGRISGEGANVVWDLAGVGPGKYVASVQVSNGAQVGADSLQVTVALCHCEFFGPALSVSCPAEVACGQSLPFTLNMSRGSSYEKLTYAWTVTGGKIISGQGTTSITVHPDDRATLVTSTVEVGGLDPAFNRTASCSVTPICPPPKLARVGRQLPPRKKSPTPEDQIRQADQDWLLAFAAKDLAKSVDFVATEGSVLAPNSAIATGHDAIRKSFAGFFAVPDLKIEWHPTDAKVARSGELGYTTGFYQMSFNTGGKTIFDRGKYVTIWKKQRDGEWKVAYDIFNSDLPSSPP
jgi:ketosteroid isomerase-like protein